MYSLLIQEKRLLASIGNVATLRRLPRFRQNATPSGSAFFTYKEASLTFFLGEPILLVNPSGRYKNLF